MAKDLVELAKEGVQWASKSPIQAAILAIVSLFYLSLEADVLDPFLSR